MASLRSCVVLLGVPGFRPEPGILACPFLSLLPLPSCWSRPHQCRHRWRRRWPFGNKSPSRLIAVADQQSTGHVDARETSVAEHPARPAGSSKSSPPALTKFLRRLGLTYIATEELTIRRLRHGRGFRYVAADGMPLRGEEFAAARGACSAAGLHRRTLRRRSPSPHPGDRAGRRRTSAVPLSSGLAAGA